MANLTAKPTAEMTMKERKAEAEALLKTITAKVKAYGKGEKIHWGHAGSLGHVIEELNNINEFLSN